MTGFDFRSLLAVLPNKVVLDGNKLQGSDRPKQRMRGNPKGESARRHLFLVLLWERKEEQAFRLACNNFSAFNFIKVTPA